MRAVDIIRKKRDGGVLDADEISFMVDAAVSGDAPDYQASAFLMAVFFRGMTGEETAALTRAMLESGESFDLSGLPGPFVDKHSSGGVGDKTSLMIAPIAAACGLQVPMMSGRALGHTGGTLDKLDSIPGYRSILDPAEFRRVLSSSGYAMTGQTERVVPADRMFYALRDVTATVESIPLITASILSKKAAEGSQALVMDVKAGSGAFMKTHGEARALASSLSATWKAMGRKIACVVSDMGSPLGRMVGNFLEVEEALDYLEGRADAELWELSRRLTAWMLLLGGKASSIPEAEALHDDAVSSGRAMEAFLANVRAQGGSPERLAALRGKFRAPLSRRVLAQASGFVSSLDAWGLGMASVRLGAGRAKTSDPVLPDVGIHILKKPGEAVAAGEELCVLYGQSDAALEAALAECSASWTISGSAPEPRSRIIEEIA